MFETIAPLVILLIGVVAVIAMIIVLRVNAFIALIGAALLISLISPGAMADKVARVAKEFGSVVGAIGIVIALAAVIGKCLMDSGAADRIVRSFLRLLGERCASVALTSSGFLLGIPVFFDTVFYLLVPLARSLCRRTGKNYLLYVTAIVAGAAVTHTLVPPTPGPLFMASRLNVDWGLMMLIGALVGLPTAAVGLVVCLVLNRLMRVPMRPYSDQPEPEPLDDDQLPSLGVSLLPVLLPVVLITANTFAIWFAGLAHERRLREGEVLIWSRFAARLNQVGTDGETAPARGVRELLPADLQQSISNSANSGSIDARLEAMLKAETWRLAREEHLLTNDAFLGIALPDEAGRILDRGVKRLPEADRNRFNTFYRDKALAGMANSARARELIDQGLDQLSAEETERLNWLLLEAAFPGERRVTIQQRIANLTAIIGNPNLALFLSAVIAMVLLVRSRGLSLKQLAQSTEIALMSGGVIILITAGGGAFGAMLRAAGVQNSISQLVGSSGQGVGLTILLAAFGVASVIKFAQGSGTVSMITTASMFAAMGVSPEMLGCHPVYLAAAIGSGSLVGDWMNNSGFWIFARMSVLTEVETLKSWTILTASLGVVGLGFTLLLAWLMPMV